LKFRKSLPSPTALLALEAVVRHRSVTQAARELGVTQAAVSRQIAVLEEDFGFPLFVRRHRAIEPTAACAALASTLSDSFSAIAQGVETLRSAAAQEVVTIGATLAFSTLWLMPRLADFRRLHPGVQIRVISQDTRLNLESGEIDIAIRYGVPPFADGKVLASCGDTIVPVCSPDYAAQLSGEKFWQGRHELIEIDMPDRSWCSWSDWFEQIGRKGSIARPSLRFSHYTEAISAAKAGQGLTLGWGVLVADFLKDGSLVRVGDDELSPAGRHNIIVPWKASRSGLRDVAAQWMIDALG
jgi:LysR family glycine cleavage system transcriptional activator